MMVMMMAITPSLKASSLVFPMCCLQFVPGWKLPQAGEPVHNPHFILAGKGIRPYTPGFND